ncbi:MAG: alpha/beta hydrolase fold domain-containing protein [Gemmatimonadota bacterium]|nr:alpha/beta hydrolase fold domain-containing protein [Gemmatimonadota bacterium]
MQKLTRPITATFSQRASVMAFAMSAILTAGACARNDRSAPADSGSADSSKVAATTSPAAPTPAEPDAQMQAVLDQLTALGPKPIVALTPAEARKQPTPADAAKAVLTKQGKPAAPDASVITADRTIPGAAAPMPTRIYTPAGATALLPIIVYYHGGGWVIANKNVYDGGARALSKMANAIVVSIDYRLAPEHKFPAAHDDALAAYQWALANASSIRGDPTRIALAGESAGGNLAIATAMSARDKGLKAPVAVLAVYPIAGSDTTTQSYIENADAKPLNRAMMGWFLRQSTRSPADMKDPRIDLVHANLKGLPPVTIVAAQIDPLRSEGEMLAQHLKDAGVPVERKQYDGVAHEFFGMGMVIDKAMDAEQYAADALKKAFGR